MTTQVYSIAEATKVLHVSTRTVRELIRAGRIEARLVGRLYLMNQAALEAYLGFTIGGGEQPRREYTMQERVEALEAAGIFSRPLRRKQA